MKVPISPSLVRNVDDEENVWDITNRLNEIERKHSAIIPAFHVERITLGEEEFWRRETEKSPYIEERIIISDHFTVTYINTTSIVVEKIKKTDDNAH